ncbi:MAG: long-chain fatty acid--CoA ligase [Bacteroidales bacterium]|nr:long-chain fatty acid--CoA ligase [Bacteroidales bacterium]
MEITRIFDLLENLKSYPPKDDMLALRKGPEWIKYSIDDYYRISHDIAYAILDAGIEKETKVITITPNRPEWNFLDMGLVMAGMVHVPVYPTSSDEEFAHIFRHSDAKYIFAGTQNIYKKIAPIVAAMDNPPEILMIDDNSFNPSLRTLGQIIEKGSTLREQYHDQLEDMKEATDKNALATIIYTSGTTGIPKGVMLSHYNLVSNSHGHAIRQVKGYQHRMISFLPLCHVYERTMNYEFQELGISIWYAEGLSTIARDIKDSHCDGFCAVPRVLEMMYGKLEGAGKSLKGAAAFIYKKAWKFANNFDFYNHKPLYLAKLRLFDKLVYKKWRDALGGHDMIVVSGGSSIRADIIRTFNAAQLRIFEGYGLTETSPVIAVNSPADGVNMIGTVGLKAYGTELSFAEDGEILTRGPHVMLGYYKDPEATAAAIDKDGWFHTGDIGYLVDGKYLKITDRKKEIFKLSAGKYVAPQAVETRLKESRYIDNAFVVGANQKFASAIIVPDFARLKEWAADNGIKGTNEELIKNPKVIALIHDEVAKVNKDLAFHEQIKREQLAADDWSVANGLLSQTLKLKRKALNAKYAPLIDIIYETEKA